MYGIFTPSRIGDIRREVLGLDQIKCWRLLIGAHVDVRQRITSPFRPDSTPGCFLEERDGVIRFKDFQQRVMHNADIADAYAHIYGCRTETAIALLQAGEFPARNRGEIKTGNYVRKSKYEGSLIDVQPFIFQGNPVFTKKHMEFWESRKISYETLQGWLDHSVYAAHSFALNGEWELAEGLTFAYKFNNGNTKIYAPGKKNKFIMSTMRTDDIWRWERPGHTKLIIDKSFKDGCHNIRLWPDHDVWVFQSENTIPSELPDFSKYEKIVLKVDNDEAGAKSLGKLLDIFEEGLPMYYPSVIKGVKIKDTDDMVVHGFEDIAKRLMP